MSGRRSGTRGGRRWGRRAGPAARFCADRGVDGRLCGRFPAGWYTTGPAGYPKPFDSRATAVRHAATSRSLADRACPRLCHAGQRHSAKPGIGTLCPWCEAFHDQGRGHTVDQDASGPCPIGWVQGCCARYTPRPAQDPAALVPLPPGRARADRTATCTRFSRRPHELAGGACVGGNWRALSIGLGSGSWARTLLSASIGRERFRTLPAVGAERSDKAKP